MNMKWFNNLAKEMQDKLNNNLQQIGEEAGQDLAHLKLKDEVLQVGNLVKQSQNQENVSQYYQYKTNGICTSFVKGDGVVIVSHNDNSPAAKLLVFGESLKHSTFLQIAGLAYGESGYNLAAMEIIPHCIIGAKKNEILNFIDIASTVIYRTLSHVFQYDKKGGL